MLITPQYLECRKRDDYARAQDGYVHLVTESRPSSLMIAKFAFSDEVRFQLDRENINQVCFFVVFLKKLDRTKFGLRMSHVTSHL